MPQRYEELKKNFDNVKAPTISYHLVFTGNPGTGKTTIARLIAQIYYKMGLLTKGQLVETDRSALVAGYLGQTAIKTQKVIQEALGGVLFIDEAYALAGEGEDSYGKEAIETLLKGMEDHRDELVKIFDRFCESNGYAISSEVTAMLLEQFVKVYETREEHFGNARAVRNVFEQEMMEDYSLAAELYSCFEALEEDAVLHTAKTKYENMQEAVVAEIETMIGA